MKKNRQFFRIFVFVFTFGLFASCSFYKPVTFGTIQGVKLKGISAEGINFDVMIPVKNPNSYSITLVDYNFDVGIENSVAGNISSNQAITIPANSEEIQKFAVNAKIKDVFTGLTAVYKIFAQPDTEIQFKGNAKVKAYLISKKIEIDQKQKVNIKN
jgi:LEA14-like dessication related protein